MKAGKKIFGAKILDAVSKEIKQIKLCNKFKTLELRTLSNEELEEVIESHLFFKEKRDKTLKVNMVAGGNKKCVTTNKEETAYPTKFLESVL